MYSNSSSSTSTAAAAASFGVIGIIELIVLVVVIVGMWKMFTKAGKPGWGAIIPVYNVYLLTKIANRPGWWTILYFIPIVNIVISLLVALDIAKAFNKSAVFGVILLWLLSGIGFLILGFGKATYNGATSAPSAPQTPAPQPQPQVAPADQTPPPQQPTS